MRRTEPEAGDWHQAAVAQFLADPDVQRAARLEMARLAHGTDVSPEESDLQGSRNYLRKCILNMSDVEVENLTVHDIGMLWARGGFGSARYRRDKGRKKRRLGRAPGAPP